MSVRTDVINLTVNINGNAAQSQLNELRKRAQDVKVEMDGLKKSTDEYASKKAELAQITGAMSDLKQEIGITSLTQKELVAELNKLNALKGSVVPFSKEFKDLQVQIDAVKDRLYDVKNGVQGLASFFSKIGDQVKQFGALAAGYLGFQFITSQFANIIQGAGKLSDQLADLRRVSGLTAIEATSLSNALGKIDTRTSVSNLRDIAIVAGKLGVAKDDILSFTKAVDQLVVALGDELGNADEITTQLGKILNVFDGKITGDNISKLGNAIVDLANKGVATGAFVVDFTQRLSGLAKTSNLSLAATLGFGAGLEENGAKVESAATAIQKLINVIALDVPKAAKVAGQGVAEFTDLFANKPEEALLAYAAGLQKNKTAFSDIASSFKDAGDEGAKVVSTLATLGQKQDFFIQKIHDTGKALGNTDEITEAFTLKNQTLGATLDKLGKDFNSFVSSSGIATFFKSIVSAASDFLSFLRKIPSIIDDNKVSFYGLIAAVVAYNAVAIKNTVVWIANTAATIANTIATKASAVATALSEAATAAYIVITSLLTGRITLATAAQRLWNIASGLGAGAIGGIIAAAVILVEVLEKVFTNTSKIAIQQKAQAELAKSAAEAYGDQVNRLEILKKALEESNTSLATKKQAYKELIEINPAFANTLQIDIDGHLKGATAIDEYIKSLKKKGEAEAAQTLSNQKNQDILKLQQQRYEQELKADSYAPGSPGANVLGRNSPAFKKAVGDIDDKIKQLQVAKDFFDSKITAALATPADTKTVVNPVLKSTEETIAMLKKQIQDLDAAFDTLDVKDTTSIKNNRDQRKKLQDELDALEGKKIPGDKKYDDIIKQAQEFKKKIDELVHQSGEVAKSQNQKEIDDVKFKYAEILKEYDELIKKLNGKNKNILGPRKAITDAEQQALDDLTAKQQQESLTKSYTEQLNTSKEFYEEEKNEQAKRFVSKEISEKIYESNVAHIDNEAKDAQLAIAEEYAKKTVTIDGKIVPAVEQAAKDVTRWKKEQLDKQTADLIDAYRAQEAERKLVEDLDNKTSTAKIQTKIVVAQVSGDFKGELDAQKELLDEELKQKQKALEEERLLDIQSITETGSQALAMELKINKDINDQKAAQDEEFRARKKKLDQDAKVAEISRWQEVYDNEFTAADNAEKAITNIEQAKINKEKAQNDANAAHYQKLLSAKLLSQGQYNKLIAKQDDDLAKKQHDLDVKSFKKNQEISITQALIDGALAIEKTYAVYGFSPFGLIAEAAMAAVTLTNVGFIASQSPPSAGQGKLLSDGPYHKDKEKGLHVVNPRTGKTELLLEKDEMVIKGDATRSNKKHTVTGTPAQIGSAINSMYGGVSWATGAHVEKPKWVTTRPPQINYNMPKIMEQGGIIRPMLPPGPPKNNAGSTSEMEGLLTNISGLIEQHINVSKEHINVSKQNAHGSEAPFSLREFYAAQAKIERAKKASGINK